jgi:hypothetical protein
VGLLLVFGQKNIYITKLVNKIHTTCHFAKQAYSFSIAASIFLLNSNKHIPVALRPIMFCEVQNTSFVHISTKLPKYTRKKKDLTRISYILLSSFDPLPVLSHLRAQLSKATNRSTHTVKESFSFSYKKSIDSGAKGQA